MATTTRTNGNPVRAPRTSIAPPAKADGPSMADILNMLQALKAENEALKAAKPATGRRPMGPLSFKVGEKGGLTVSGLGQRFPVTLYKAQWEFLLDHSAEIRAALKANASKLAAPRE